MRLIIHKLSDLKLRQNLLWLSLFTMATIIIWIGYTIYTSYQKSTVDTKVERLRKPLNPAIDISVIESLSDRFYPPEEFTILKITPDSTSAPTPLTPPLLASPSATIEPTPISSESAFLP